MLLCCYVISCGETKKPKCSYNLSERALPIPNGPNPFAELLNNKGEELIKRLEAKMVSKEQKKASAAMHEKLQLLRSLTNSHAQRETSIILDAAKYIQELKQKVERLNQDVTTGETSRHIQDPWPEVVVESLETGFLVNIFSEKSCPGLLVSILDGFDELGLHVMEARVSCANSFRLEALGGENDENGEIDAQAVKQAVSDAIRNWSEKNDAN